MRYRLLSGVYDRALEALYREGRSAAAAALRLGGGEAVLDAPCGTGQSFDALVEGVGPRGRVLGLDLSEPMLDQARRRIAARGWRTVDVLAADVGALDPVRIPVEGFDRLLVFLGMTVFPEPEVAFAGLWSRLRPGGRCVIVDVYAPTLGLQGRLVNLTAGADIRRRSWEPLATVARGFERRELSARWQHGGSLYLAAGDKPR